MSAGCIKILFEPDFGEIAQMEVYRARRGVFFDPPDPGGPDPPDPGSGVPDPGVPESRIRGPGISGGHISHHPSKTSCCIYSIHAYNRRAFCTRSLSHKRRYFDVNMQVPVTLFCVSFCWDSCLNYRPFWDPLFVDPWTWDHDFISPGSKIFEICEKFFHDMKSENFHVWKSFRHEIFVKKHVFIMCPRNLSYCTCQKLLFLTPFWGSWRGPKEDFKAPNL